jgi:hypothetical protein
VPWRLPWGAHPNKPKPFGPVEPECRQHQGADCLGQHVQATHLLNTGAIGAAEGTHRPEVEIVGEDRITVGEGPASWAGSPWQRNPLGRKAVECQLGGNGHVDQEPGHQLRTSASSRSSIREAA